MNRYQSILDHQTVFFNSNFTKPLAFRIEQLNTLRTVLRSHESLLYEAIYKDFKKGEFETYGTELALLYSDIAEAIRSVSAWSRKKRVRTNLTNFPSRNYIIPEPLGVSLIIGAWNYPYQLSLAPVIAAMAAGNTMILKPSEVAFYTSALMAKLIRAHFKPEYFTVIEGGVEETTELLELKFDKIFFTGSVPVGKKVYQAAANHLTPVTLELGGKSPAIITKECNMKESVKRLVWAKFLNSGQTCIAPDYILVDTSVQQEFLETVKQFIEHYDYAFENHNYVQIINEKNFNRLTALLDQDKIYYGGQTHAANRYISPTVMTNVSFDDKVMQEEIFGPILPVISYTDLNQAILEIKKQPKPLSCYIFTTNHAVRDQILHELSFGGGAVNDAIMHIANSRLPFGGVGHSGIGSYHGEAGFRSFSHYKSILEKPFWFEPSIKYPPYTVSKFKWIRKLLG